MSANPDLIGYESALRVRLRDKAQAQRAKPERLAAQAQLLPFCQWTYPMYQTAPHLELIARELEAIEAGENDRLIIEAPPRHSKTETISIRFPAWALCRRPERRIIAASYGERLASEAGRKVRNIVDTQTLFPEVRLAEDSKARDLWHTAQGGQFLAVGIGSGVIGFGGDLITIDDPLKKREEAESQVQRDNIWNWYGSEILTRQERGTAIVVVMHRWHEDDLVGRLLAQQGDRWRVVRLPALAESGDVLGRAAGEALWPWRFTKEELEEIRDSPGMGPRNWNSLYQQRPAPEEGAIFKWFPTYDPAKLPTMRAIYIPVDTALGGQDATAATAWGWDGSRVYLLDAMSFRGETPEAERRVQYFHNKLRQQYPTVRVTPLHRDNVHIDKIMAQHLRAGVPATTVGSSNGAKDARMGMPVAGVKLPGMGGTSNEKREALGRLVSVEFEGGRALIPEAGFAPWLEEWLEQHKAFPYGQHDDYVETTIIVLWHAFRRSPSLRVTEPVKVYNW